MSTGTEIEQIIEEAYIDCVNHYTIIHGERESNIERVSYLSAQDYMAKYPARDFAFTRDFLAGAIFQRYMEWFKKWEETG